MRISLIIFLLISLKISAQTEKGDILVSPQIFASEFNSTNKDFGVSTSIHYFLRKYISIGVILKQDFSLYNAPDIRNFDRSITHLQLLPEIQYQMLVGRFAPFVKLQILNDNFYFQYFYIDNPAIPKNQEQERRLGYASGFVGIGGCAGLNWYLNSRTGLYGVINFERHDAGEYFNNVGIGAQFILVKKKLNKPRK